MSILWSSLSFTMTLFLMMKHPLSLVLVLILLTMITMLSFMLFMNLSWLSMILFLVFLGGLLVIFTYLSALIPNEIYNLNPLWLILMMSPTFSLHMASNSLLEQSQKMYLNEILFMSETSSILLFLIYLVITLLTAMIMTQQLKSPLSQTNH